MFKIVILALFVALAGCQTTPEAVPPPNRATLTHPALPSPIADRSFKTKVITDQSTGKIYIGMSYEDDLEFRKYLEDVLKYVKEMKATACYYRTELKEPACQFKTDPIVTPVVEKKAPVVTKAKTKKAP